MTDDARDAQKAGSEHRKKTGALGGVWNIVPTPFTDNGDLDHESIGTLVDFVIGSGVNGMTILGVNGEFTKLTDAERSQLIEAVIARADYRLPICVGVSAGSTHAAVIRAREAAAAGAHSLMFAPSSGAGQTE